MEEIQLTLVDLENDCKMAVVIVYNHKSIHFGVIRIVMVELKRLMSC